MRNSKITATQLLVLAIILTSSAASRAQIVLNPNSIQGDVQVGTETITGLSMRATSVVDNLTASQFTSPNATSATYDLTVQVETGTSRDYGVDADIRMGSDRMFLRGRAVTVTDGVIAVQDFIFNNPAFVDGSVTVTGGGLISSISIFAQQLTAPFDFYQTSAQAGTFPNIADFSLPVLPGQQLRCSGSVLLTTGIRINLPLQNVTVPASGSVRCDYSVETPQVGNIGGAINFAGPDEVNSYLVQFSGSSSKSLTLNRVLFDGPDNFSNYDIADVPAGTNYSGFARANLNNSDDLFDFPELAFDPARFGHSVTAGSTTTVDMGACQAFITGTFEFTGSATLSDLSSGDIRANGNSAAGSPSRFGFALDRLAPQTGAYDLIVSDGDWAPNSSFLRLFRPASDPRGFINESVFLSFDPSPFDFVPLLCGQTVQKDFSFATGSTTINFSIGGGQVMSNPRISGSCTHRDPSTNELLYSYSYNSFTSGQNNVTQASVAFEAPEALCTVRAEASVNGTFLTFGTLDGVEIDPGVDVIVDIGGPSISVISPESDFCIDANSVTVTGTATDDVEVVSVTVNGISATLTNAGNASDPAEVNFSVNVPLPTKGPHTLTIIATDSSGKTGQVTQTVFNDAGPPTLSFTPADGTTTGDATVDIMGNVEDDAGVDSVVISVNGIQLAVLDMSGSLSTSFEQLGAALEIGQNTITVVATDISEKETVVIHGIERLANVAPVVDAGPDESINEGDNFASAGSFTDPDADTWTATVDYGEGAGPQVLPVNQIAKTFNLSHVYAQEGTFAVTVTVNDGTADGSDTATVTVSNVAPAVVAGPDESINEGDSFTRAGSFIDPGADTWTATVDYGEGAGPQVLAVNQVAKTVSLSHVYADDGVYTVTVTVDDGTADGSDTVIVTVVNVAPTVVADAPSVTVNEAQTAGNTGSFADVGDDIVTITASAGIVSQTGGQSGSWSWVFPSTDGPDESQTVTVTATDSDGAFSTTTFNLTVLNVPPVAVDIAYGALEDTVLNISAAQGALFGDSDVGDDSLSATVLAGPSNGILDLDLNGSFSYTPNLNSNGNDSYTYTVTDDDGATDTGKVTISVNPVNDAPTVSADDKSVQYSDPVSVTISGSDIDSTSLSIATAALPAGLSLSAANCAENVAFPPGGLDCTWTVSGNVTAAPGVYPVEVTVTDNGELGTPALTSETATFEITVEREDARSTYSGPLFLSSAEDGSFTVTLMATIRDITAVDPATDPDAGDIRNASVHFEDETGASLCSASPVTLVFAGDETVGSASCDYNGSLGNNEELPLEVTVVVENYYIDTSDNEVVVLIVKPGEGKITGGGQLEMENSAGVYPAATNLSTNYGFNAMAQKKGKKKVQLRGRATIILRAADGRKYKIKSNALLSLGVDLDPDRDGNSEDEPHYAEFESKANLTDVTDELNPISLGGNLLLQLRMTDNGEPGENDTISFTLWDGGVLLFSSNWDGAQSVEQNVARGNLQVH